jgi:hypothetical protein
VLLAGFDPKNGAREVEGVDLAAPVAQELGGAHRAGYHLVEGRRPIALGEDFFVLGEAADGAFHGAGAAGLRRVMRGRAVARGGGRSTVCMGASAKRLM